MWDAMKVAPAKARVKSQTNICKGRLKRVISSGARNQEGKRREWRRWGRWGRWSDTSSRES